jgi:predicted aspartyl protease
MKFPFNPDEGPVLVRARLSGPKGDALARMVLDTGATSTLLNWHVAVLLGYDPSIAPTRIQITTGSGVEFAAQITIERIEALGRVLLAFPVLCHTLPPSAVVDGLLGLDFLRGQHVVLDFRSGAITLD